MKNFRKLLAVLLCMVLIVAVLPMTMAFAEDTALCQPDTVYHVFVLDDEDVVTFNFAPQQSGYYSLRSYGYEDTYVDVYDEYYNLIAFDDDSGKEYNFICNVYLEEGKTYYFDMGAYFAYESEFDFVLTNLSALDIASLDEASPDTVYIDADNQSVFYEFTATADSYYAFSSSSDEVDTYLFAYDSEWNMINKNDDGSVLYNGCVNVFLYEGETCYFEATTYSDSLECAFDVVAEKTECVIDIEITSTPDNAVLYEGFVDEIIDFSGLSLRLTYSDGSIVDYTYTEDTEIVGTTLYFDWDIDENGEYFMCIMTDFAYAEMPIEVVENPVKSLSVKDFALEIVEHSNGFYEGDNYYYEYELPGDMVVDVEYKDGTTATVDFASGINNLPFKVYDNQAFGDYFELGENIVYLEYYGVVTEVVVNIIDIPYELGDVDCDGEISVMDATDIQRYCALKLEFDEIQLKLADTDKDAEVSVMDATRIQRFLAQKITEF